MANQKELRKNSIVTQGRRSLLNDVFAMADQKSNNGVSTVVQSIGPHMSQYTKKSIPKELSKPQTAERNRVLSKHTTSSNAYGSARYKNEPQKQYSPAKKDESYLSDDVTEKTEPMSHDYSPERVTGLPNPSLYDQFYINKYSFPKGLIAIRKEESKVKYRKSLYDIKQPNLRKGVSGWKLTKRPLETFHPEVNSTKKPPRLPSQQRPRTQQPHTRGPAKSVVPVP